MSDEAPKKKGGKLPIIIAVVAMLGGGGFFMMKGKKEDKKVEAEVALAEAEVLLPDEFIVNMVDRDTFIRAKIGFKTVKDFKPEEVAKHDAEISDAIIGILKTTKPDETTTTKHITKLKRRVAAALNKILEMDHGLPKKKKKKKDEDEHDVLVDEEEIPEGWDSVEGPVLKVFFKVLTTQ